MTPDIQILARTIYGEARGEYNKVNGGIAALIAVANVVVNRTKQRTWFGKTIAEVCQKPWQFSCWNVNDPNLRLLQANTILDPIFEVCLMVATKVIQGEWPDLTKGCDHYYAVSLKTPPPWAQGRVPKCQIGQHLFFDLKERH
ncbi:cell wall hydrolase [Candidatus Paracaedibacter symbiosus]|uniref:cell wall hydrolase n=1 Tax=Candidatus Paracaedibacter symbiosus TaxID=244582 RepID=UPI000509D7DD|nr:cell wall hydrolase [Candidatus Paracaedibacter symbiosus]